MNIALIVHFTPKSRGMQGGRGYVVSSSKMTGGKETNFKWAFCLATGIKGAQRWEKYVRQKRGYVCVCWDIL